MKEPLLALDRASVANRPRVHLATKRAKLIDPVRF